MAIIKTFVPDKPDAKIYKKLEDIPVPEKFSHKHEFFWQRIGNAFGNITKYFDKEPATQFRCKICTTEVYYCPSCEGYIEGKPHEDKYDDIDEGMCARKAGTNYYCNKCGEKIAGIVSMMS